MLDTTKLVIMAAVVVVAAILIWFVMTKTNLGKSLKGGGTTNADGTSGTKVKIRALQQGHKVKVSEVNNH